MSHATQLPNRRYLDDDLIITEGTLGLTIPKRMVCYGCFPKRLAIWIFAGEEKG